jgi:hypothetical protein
MWRRSAERGSADRPLSVVSAAAPSQEFGPAAQPGRHPYHAFMGMQHKVMPPHAIIIGMPAAMALHMAWQHCITMSFMAASMAVISQVMPVSVMVQVARHIIIGVGIVIGIMPAIDIMGFIIGFIIMGIMPMPVIPIGIAVAAVAACMVGIVIVAVMVVSGRVTGPPRRSIED